MVPYARWVDALDSGNKVPAPTPPRARGRGRRQMRGASQSLERNHHEPRAKRSELARLRDERLKRV